ncbi:MAG: hypothetical protein HFG10_03255 [Oscillibacter sp.]|jgi:hypothetical protein|nr:hypothetical protein [Oscillibacter sp.]
MRSSYEGIGQWAATFACGTVAEGEMVKISANGTVSACERDDGFCGMVLAVSRGGDACTVVLGGMVTAGYSGDTAPTVGWVNLAADGRGGVTAAAAGRSYLAVDVDTSAETVTFIL